MPQAIAYLAFDGTCADAMRFYEQALGGKLEVMMSGADSPMAAQIPKESAHRILHARLALPVARTTRQPRPDAFELMVFRPYLSANFGGVYGPGVQDGLVAGPELGFNIGLTDAVQLGLKVAYDYQFRNSDWDKGIAWGGLDLGYRF